MYITDIHDDDFEIAIKVCYNWFLFCIYLQPNIVLYTFSIRLDQIA